MRKTLAVEEPAPLVAVIVYAVLSLGLTPMLPETGSVPVTPVMATESVLAVVQLSVAGWPAIILSGETVKVVICGNWLGEGGGGVKDPDDFPPQATNPKTVRRVKSETKTFLALWCITWPPNLNYPCLLKSKKVSSTPELLL